MSFFVFSNSLSHWLGNSLSMDFLWLSDLFGILNSLNLLG